MTILTSKHLKEDNFEKGNMQNNDSEKDNSEKGNSEKEKPENDNSEKDRPEKGQFRIGQIWKRASLERKYLKKDISEKQQMKMSVFLRTKLKKDNS